MQRYPPSKVQRAEARRLAPNDTVELLSRWLDSRFRVPGLGWRFGLDPLLGLLPVVGDVTSLVLSLLILAEALRQGVPRITLLRMGVNLAIDSALGALPLVGDLFDVWFKANQRNLGLLRRSQALGARSRAVLLGDWVYVGLVMAAVVAVLLAAVWLVSQLLSLLARGLFGG